VALVGEPLDITHSDLAAPLVRHQGRYTSVA
jgi:hypothetical protein